MSSLTPVESPVCSQKKSNEKLVDELFDPNKEGVSEFIKREDIEKSQLNFSRNGNGRNGIYFGVKKYNWEAERNKNKVIALRTIGFNNDKRIAMSRPIRDDIHKHHKKNGCVVCGSKTDLVTDHKNDLYNDNRVLKTDTQTLDDFQCLCNHCNLLKRQHSKKTKETGKRYGATNIYSLKKYGVDFIEGDENFDQTDINAMKGTYWYDPVKFIEFIIEKNK
tara:strand:- start:317 stop:976 length:660 start_codon:yes stop_codon:yes gene_type:complete